jgi:dipeptidyl aminopeptidase/acylaminoacyl peptidase
MMRSPVRNRRVAGWLALVTLVCVAPAAAQTRPADWNPEDVLKRESFTRPPDAIADAVLAPRYRNVTLSQISPSRDWFLNEVGDGPVDADRFSKDFHDLGGQFIDYAANRDRSLTIRSNAGLQLISASDGTVRDIELPRGARVSGASWSPDGSRVAFFVHTAEETHIWAAGTDGEARQLTRRPVLATLQTSFDWSADGSTIATVLVPEDRAAMPRATRRVAGPQVKMTEEGENMLRVYKSLMATPFDQELLEWHATGQVALIDVERRRTTEVGSPTMVRGLDVSPDGGNVLVTRMVKPFSYVVPVRQFGSVQEIWSADGDVMASVTEDELDTGVQGGPRAGGPGFSGSGAADGPRSIAWRSDGAGLVYLEQEPESDDEEEARPDRGGDEEGDDDARRKDRLMLWAAPFGDGDKTVLFENDRQMASARFSNDMSVVFVSERRGQRTHEFAVFLDDTSETHTLARYEAQDVYENPGSLVEANGRFPVRRRFGRGGGGSADIQLSADGMHAFYAGTEYDESPLEVAPKSFIDKIELRTGEKERIYETGNDGMFERPLAYVDLEGGDYVVSRETRTEVPQAYRGDTQLTSNEDFTPDLTHAPTEEFTVTRPDGFEFRVNVTLPQNYRAGTRLPAMFWFYPREYTDQEDYDETGYTYNKNAFPNFGTRSIEYLVRLGYAVVEPDAPIVGKAGQMNNNYEHDLRNNLAAVIDELDERELIDRRRIGIGGHSYGAFSTVNAMVHTPFFKAGIAGDGNYNRTLTPLHFQSERRTLWEAKDVYISMSPFLQANNLTGALLMYHGLHDQNVGTDPIHSPKLFHALNGLDKEAAMYLYPYEDHGPAAEETLLDLWARWTAWLDTHLVDGDTQQNVISQGGSGS